MIAVTDPQDIYPRIVGQAWWNLPEAVRSAHAVGEKRGRFRVICGQCWIARRLLGYLRLPRGAESVPVALEIRREGARQSWHRRFGAESFTTQQWATANGRFLIEQFERWELCFMLRVEGASLVYEQCGARLCLGGLRWRVPLALAPRVRAREEGEEAARVRIAVSVNLPFSGLLIAYEGHLEVESNPP